MSDIDFVIRHSYSKQHGDVYNVDCYGLKKDEAGVLEQVIRQIIKERP